MTALTRVSDILEALADKILTNTRKGEIVDGYLNFPVGLDNEEKAQMYLDLQLNLHKSNIHSHNMMKQKQIDEQAAIDAGDASVSDL